MKILPKLSVVKAKAGWNKNLVDGKGYLVLACFAHQSRFANREERRNAFEVFTTNELYYLAFCIML
ncbi:MAG: hypothetical protein IKP00_00845 [Victivallales bacterium]|nr:hypothetical protein [Victivallales bacterium]